MIIQKKSQLHVAIQLIDTEEQEEGVDPADSAKWSEYVERYVNDQQVVNHDGFFYLDFNV